MLSNVTDMDAAIFVLGVLVAIEVSQFLRKLKIKLKNKIKKL